MKVSVVPTEGLERRMTIEVPAESVEQELKARIQSLARGAKLPGFRPGKVPLKIIEQKYGAQVRQEVRNALVESSFGAAVREQNLRPAGRPTIDAGNIVPGEALAFTATFDIYPDIELAPLEDVEVKKPVATITDEDVAATLEALRTQHVRWDAVERPAATGDRVTIDFTGKIAGEPFSGGEAENFAVVIGSNTLVPGFAEQLLERRAGDAFTIDVQFPGDYRAEALAGKTAQFEVDVRGVEEAHLPTLDDEFARNMGVIEGGLEALRRGVREGMQQEMERAIKDKVKHAVLDALLQINTIDLPASLVEAEINGLVAEARASGGEQAGEPDRAQMQVAARRKVALGLLEAEIIRRNNLKADPDKMREALTTLASGYQKPEEVVRWYLQDRQRLGQIEAFVLEDQVVEWALSKMKVAEEAASYADLVRIA